MAVVTHMKNFIMAEQNIPMTVSQKIRSRDV